MYVYVCICMYVYIYIYNCVCVHTCTMYVLCFYYILLRSICRYISVCMRLLCEGVCRRHVPGKFANPRGSRLYKFWSHRARKTWVHKKLPGTMKLQQVPLFILFVCQMTATSCSYLAAPWFWCWILSLDIASTCGKCLELNPTLTFLKAVLDLSHLSQVERHLNQPLSNIHQYPSILNSSTQKICLHSFAISGSLRFDLCLSNLSLVR